METHGEDAAVQAVGALADPARRRLYDYVSSKDEPVAREDAASATGMSRTLAAYHLDRLAEAGLLETSYARDPGRGGPGAGRPAKRYVRSARETSVSVPPRDYRLLAELMTSAVAADDTGRVREALVSAAEAEGTRSATPARTLETELRDRGYEPSDADGSDITLRNCPFHRLAQRHTDLVCGMNHALLRGVLAAHGDDPERARLDPQEGRCCVVLTGSF
ncbi:helix-turn-helix domain-containing protein [Leifsonia sp. fls2-241-R2A-40a]|uniref:helix-turn-helix transcriptional regulator n=1 Tax=Leifsonia sp. fls2-241-R2A-40a TaxID=3040290 RepID=UPI00254F6436|nr:helix-turn-helix domain-containing protein [Leifsonia sp. fls2-241-R2A-40a]